MGIWGGSLEKQKSASEQFEGLQDWGLTRHILVLQKTVENIQPSAHLPDTVLTFIKVFINRPFIQHVMHVYPVLARGPCLTGPAGCGPGLAPHPVVRPTPAAHSSS